jgi:F-type H+-transporting ATPase subunit b
MLSASPAIAQEAEDIGFPQLKQTDTFASQVFWLAVSFLLLYVLMSKLALPRVGAVLDTRRAKRQENLREAEVLNEEAVKVKKAFEVSLAKAQAEAQAMLSAAEQEISVKSAAEFSVFSDAARNRVVAAEQKISKARQDAVASLADISAEIAADMVGKIAGLQVSKADAKITVAGLMQKE